MDEQYNPAEEEIDRLYWKLKREAEEAGYYLNPDVDFTKELIKGLLINEKRYAYWACPCRLAAGVRGEDRDIICPCNYRDADVDEFDACYCALYVSRAVAEGKKKTKPIPERRPKKAERKTKKSISTDGLAPLTNLAYPVWRCVVCGYLCARENPPGICPICKASKDRFDRFL